MWFEDLFGFEEESPSQVRQNLSLEGSRLHSLINGKSYECGTLEIPSLRELRNAAAKQAQDDCGKTSLSEVIGDVQSLHADQANNGALFQVASQFNLLEMASPSAVPEDGVGIYEFDPTQGPACAIAAGAGTVLRNYLVPLKDQIGQTRDQQIDCLADIGAEFDNESQQTWRMQNGYVFASATGLKRITQHLSTLDDQSRDQLRSKLRVGIMWDTEVTLGASRPKVDSAKAPPKPNPNLLTQVYCSAVPVAYSTEPEAAWEAFARLVLEATYEATFHTAVLNKARNGSNILFLTMIGGGAFGNQPRWITDALARAMHLHQNSGLDVRMVSHRSPNMNIKPLLDQFGKHHSNDMV